jgi:hypothetical protein
VTGARLEVVKAIIEACTANDMTALPLGATPGECELANAGVDQLLAAECLLDPRRLDPFRAYRPGGDWDDLFDRLNPLKAQQRRDRPPYMPPLAAQHFAERCIFPA